MKMPITLGEYLEWKELKNKKHLAGQGGTWIIDQDCTIYTHRLVFSAYLIANIMHKFGMNQDVAIRYLFENEVTEPLFPHIWWKDEVLHEKSGIWYIRKWLDPDKARFIKEKIE